MTEPERTAGQLADEAINAILETQWSRLPAFIVDSPPGAGKTGVVERMAVQGYGVMRERVMITTQTNEQAFDIARRLCRTYPRLLFHMIASKKLIIPSDLRTLSNFLVVHYVRDLPAGPCAVIGNGAKWSWVETDEQVFDLQIVDEAYQLPDYQYQQIVGLAARQALIGDPGQIDPVIQSELERWRCDPAGPHIPAPRALLERHPDVPVIRLPVSRRLVQDTVDFVQPAFYAGMPFVAFDRERHLRFKIRGIVPIDTPLDAAAAGQSMLMIELPAMMTGEADIGLADELVWTVRRVLERGAEVTGKEGQFETVTRGMIGVACAHVAQVHAVRERLGPELSDVFVETANRFQGLERPLMFVQHPLSGRADATAFHLDAGRLCVLLSRHRIACWIFGRQGISRQLRRYAPVGDRSLGISQDSEFEGWRSNMALMQAIEKANRIYSVPERSRRDRTG